MPPKQNSPEGGVLAEYFEATRTYTEEYGPQTLVLMQVGSFYEVYGLKDAPNGPRSRIEDFCRLCELKLAEKSKERFENYTVYMAGFGEYNLEKYVRIMTDAGYNCVVFVQEDDMRRAGSKRRIFHSVYSAGTFLSLEDTNNAFTAISNNTMVVWVHKYTTPIRQGSEAKYLCGFAVVDILTGHSYLYEYTTLRILSPTTFDELERAMASFNPTEIVFLHENPNSSEAEQVLQFTGMSRCKSLHKVAETSEKVQRLTKQAYIDTTLAFYLGEQVSTICQEFTTYEFATRCFVYLLDFLQNHNPHLVQKIMAPVFTNSSSRVILANHTLKQLQMLGPQGVISFLNDTKTAMGSRLFQRSLQNPISDPVLLNSAYEHIEWALKLGEEKQIRMRKHLAKIRDLERIGRRLLYGKIYPAAVFECYRGIREWSAVLTEGGLSTLFIDDSEFERVEFLDDLENRLDLAVCEGMNHFDFLDQPLFRKEGATPELIKAWKELEQNQERLQIFAQELNRLVKAEDWVKIHETAKSGSSLQTTPTRAAHFKKIFAQSSSSNPNTIQVLEAAIPLDTFRVVSTGSTMTLESPHLQHTCKEIMKSREKVAQLSAECYQAFLKDWESRWGAFMKKESQKIAEMDVVLTKAHLAAKYRYCRPTLVPEGEKAFFSAKDLRHVLIEHLQTNEMYVANDMALGKDQGEQGLLLFGTNAVGKTSLIKAAGIAVLMAQAGMYVPCSEFQLCPYNAVYSRILGNDDLFRGLSTFVVEMSELRVILKSADCFSLVLGDELCSGTETESALSIFVAGLQHLVAQGASFVFATHFHEIVHYEEIENLAGAMSMKHLSVVYDREKEMLVYDRKLREGSGEAIYGLEVAKSLFMPQDFLEKAFQLRAKYFPTTAKVSPLSCKVSKYNSRKIKTLCEICKKRMGEEVHHKVAQHLADKEGFLPGGFVPKNHKANLMSVCEDCHGKIHHQCS